MDIKPDGTEGASASWNGMIYIFDPNTNVTHKSLNMNPIQRPQRVEYSPDGSKLAIVTNQGCIVIYDTSDYDKAPVKIYNGAVIQENAVFTADSKQLIVGGFNGGSQAYANPVTGGKTEKWCFRVFDVETGAVLQEINVGSDPRCIDLSNDGSKVIVTTTRNGSFIYNVSDWTEYAHLEGGHEYAIKAADFSPDDKLVVTADEGGVINLWDVESKALVKKFNNVNTAPIRLVRFSPDGKNVLTTATYGAARLFEVASGELISLLGGFEGAIREIEYSPNGKYIVASAYDQQTKVFAADGTYLTTLAVKDYIETGYIISKIRFTPDGSHVFVALRNFPNFIQKWAMPQDVDKAPLVEAMAKVEIGSEAYEFAKGVLNNKYASVKAVYRAIAACNNQEVIAVTANIQVSADGYNHKNEELNVNKGGYAYLKVNATSYVDPVIKLTNIADETSKQLTLEEVIVLDTDVSYDNITYYLKVKMPEGGAYDVTILNGRDGRVLTHKATRINVDGEKYETDDFLYSINDGEVTIERGISGDRIVNIPDYIEGYPVTKIAPYAFFGYGRIITHMEVNLPSTLKEIGDYAFRSCNSLRRLKFPEGLEKIGAYAFYDCRLLGIVEIPKSVTSVGNYAMSRTGTGTLILNADTKLPTSFFDGNYRIREVIYADGITEISTTMSSQFLLESIYIPASVTSITSKLNGSYSAFFRQNEEKVNLYGVPESYAETFAAQNPDYVTFVPLAAPVIGGVEDGATYDLYTIENELKATWDHGHVAYLNGVEYKKGSAITEPGEYTLKVVNGYEEYSTEIKFTVVDTTPPPYTLGEMDGDGEITVADALAILRIVARLAEPIGNQALAADCDLDGEITVADALAVLRYVAKLTDTIG